MNKSTLILIAVFVLLGALAVFYLMPSEEREASYDTATFSMSLDSASIVKIDCNFFQTTHLQMYRLSLRL